jgi:site-specific DNA-adenine methylase|tara:strand:+ start:42 stop:944 length:903 start_codon:yes stop_codon:yes gene_type:complete
MKQYKTPLRYPGGKSRACIKLDTFFPDLSQYSEFREPFLGGGSVAIHVTKKYPKIKIWVNDLYEPLTNFWQQLQHEGNYIYKQLQQLKSRYPDPSSARGLFLDAKKIINDWKTDAKDRAVAFYIVNKCSFSGLTESSSFSKQASDSNFSMRGIERIPGFSQLIERWKITGLSYEDMLSDEKNVFTYLDPPYDIKDNLYGKKGDMHKSFDHDQFAYNCDHHTGHQLISYNSSQLVKDRFSGWNVSQFNHTYTMRSVGQYMKNQQQRQELVIYNYGSPVPKLQFSFGECYNYKKLENEGLVS